MDFTKILAISGKPGLYEMLSQTKTGFIVESLLDGKRFPVFAHERVSSLEEISIFSTLEEDIPLKDIFKMIYEKMEGQSCPDPKSPPNKLKAFFTETIPDHDQERVYTSDMKKVMGWYNLLLEKGMMVFEEEQESTDTVEKANGKTEEKPTSDQPQGQKAQESDESTT
jgi:hypothetical protein